MTARSDNDHPCLPPPPYWRTVYFETEVIHKRGRRIVTPSLILAILANPIKVDSQPDGRMRFWGPLPGSDHWVRVITLADGETVHNVFPDRNYRP